MGQSRFTYWLPTSNALTSAQLSLQEVCHIPVTGLSWSYLRGPAGQQVFQVGSDELRACFRSVL